ncbi:FtsX-like permease family protein [Sphingorhabdus sp.]|uniref:ABC transporter permease n=1 Tax=Sphingorhabdus sp. TaxID=1902408 RepID=UPI003D81BC65
MLRLALAYLKDRSLTTALNILLLGLAVATLVILLSFSTQLGNRFERDAKGIDLVVGAKGSPLQLILSSIYQIDVPTGNIPLESIDLLRNDPAVESAIPVALGDNFRGFRIVGTEAAYLDLYGAKLAQGRVFAKEQETVIGAAVARDLGMGLGQRFVGSHGLEADSEAGEHDHAPFTNVGILAPTGTVIDRLILTPVESVWDAHGIEHDHAAEEGHGHDEGAHNHDEKPKTLTERGELKPEITALLVSYRSAFGAVRIPTMVNRQTAMQAAVPATETARLLSLLGVGIDGARLFAWLLAITGGMSIFVALLNAAQAREGDLALLRVMGATRGSVFGTILSEGLVTAIAGIIIGFIIAFGAMALAVSSFMQLGDLGVDPFKFHPAMLGIVGGVLGIGLIAALIPALRVFRTDLAATLARAS